VSMSLEETVEELGDGVVMAGAALQQGTKSEG
jgi:hypothetical protein